MAVVAVIGAQWGDEGKGKIVDLLAERAAVVVRFSGGNNAGHTVINHLGEFKLHLIPAGIFNPHAQCLIGSGVAVDPATLLEEIDLLTSVGIDVSRLSISDRSQVIMPYHTMLDALEEEAKGLAAIGTTRKGVGPAFMDKAARIGIRMGDLLDEGVLYQRLSFVLAIKNKVLSAVFGVASLTLEDLFQQYWAYGQRLAPYVRDTVSILQGAIKRKEFILLEGAQGAMLDPDYGTYPYVTSSSPMAGNACLGAGLGPTQIDQVLGICKAYTTRVGTGPMPTELRDDVGALLRHQGQEYGATTGRPRRCGWFDAVVARFTAQINGFSTIAITRLDVLDSFPLIKVCTHYKLDGATYDFPPSRPEVFARCQPAYEEWPGWQRPTGEARRLEDLPLEARNYVHRLSQLVQCPPALISVGPRREQTIILEALG